MPRQPLAPLEPKHGGVAHRYLTNRYRAASTGVVEPVRKEYIGICEPHKAKWLNECIQENAPLDTNPTERILLILGEGEVRAPDTVTYLTTVSI